MRAAASMICLQYWRRSSSLAGTSTSGSEAPLLLATTPLQVVWLGTYKGMSYRSMSLASNSHGLPLSRVEIVPSQADLLGGAEMTEMFWCCGPLIVPGVGSQLPSFEDGFWWELNYGCASFMAPVPRSL